MYNLLVVLKKLIKIFFIDNEPLSDNIKNFIESSRVPIIFNNMLDDWEPFKWNLNKWNSLFGNQPLDCRKGKITCTKVILNMHYLFNVN